MRYLLVSALLCLSCSTERKAPQPHGESQLVNPHAEEKLPVLPPVVERTYDLRELEKKGTFATITKIPMKTLNDPAYHSGPRTFFGYPLKALLKTLDGFSALKEDEVALRFVCIDGYRTTFPLSALIGAEGLIATGLAHEKDAAWDVYEHGKQSLTPAPFYLVWADEKVSKKRPWPYQLTAIEVINKKAQALRTKPLDNAHLAGYELFATRCQACHSMNLIGGSMGPELNVPKNICEYRNRSFMAAFIHSPQSFRAKSPMPPAPDIQGEKADALLDYICAMRHQKVCNTAVDCTNVEP